MQYGHRRAKWVIAGVSLFVFSATTLVLFAARVQGDARAKLVRSAYLQDISKDHLTLLWETSKAENSGIQIGELIGGKYVFAAPRWLSDKVTRHEFRLEHLKPGTHYAYRVVKPQGLGLYQEGNFVTAPTSDQTPFHFVVWGDNQHNPSIFTQVSEAMLATQPDFGVGVGDFSDNGFNRSQWATEFFQPGAHFLANVPVFLAAGNHDYGFAQGVHWNFSPSSPGRREYRALFRNPSGNRMYYSFNYGNSHFIVLDTNENRDYGKFDLPPSGEQYRWLIQDLESPLSRQATFRFIFFHEPPFTTSWDDEYYDGEPLLREHLVPLFEKYHITLVFNGHAHVYERGILNGVAYVITGGGGGDVDTKRHKLWPHVTVVVPKHHYVNVSVSGNHLECAAKSPEGEVLDSFSLTPQ
ncbi:metallophosphoesterase [Bdellovibrionota bacterium FG-1]